MHVVAGCDVLNRLDKSLKPKRHDRHAALVELNGARRSNRRTDHARSCGFGFDAGALDFSRRKLDSAIVGVLALVDGDVVHPHRILLRGWRGIGQPHRIAVELDLAVRWCGRRRRSGRLVIKTQVGTCRHSPEVPPICGLLRCRRIDRFSVRVLIIDRIVTSLRSRR